jgi:hypothetical protein
MGPKLTREVADHIEKLERAALSNAERQHACPQKSTEEILSDILSVAPVGLVAHLIEGTPAAEVLKRRVAANPASVGRICRFAQKLG